MRAVLITLGCIIGLFAIIFLTNEFEIFGIKFWGVRKENAKREVFENTQSYVESKRQELVKLHHEWSMTKEADEKRIIENSIRHNFANFNADKIQDPELHNFLVGIMNN